MVEFMPIFGYANQLIFPGFGAPAEYFWRQSGSGELALEIVAERRTARGARAGGVLSGKRRQFSGWRRSRSAETAAPARHLYAIIMNL